MKLKRIIKANRYLLNKLPFANRIKIRGRDNTIAYSNSYLKDCKIDFTGGENRISLDGDGVYKHCHFHIGGNNNQIVIGRGVTCNNLEIWIEDDNNIVVVGDNTCFSGKIHIACIEGTKVSIGKDCLFSSDITIRTGDSHTILSLEDGNRLNQSKDVIICEHVWIGNKASINKGSIIQKNCVVGTGTILTSPINEENVVIAGVPGKVIKHGIDWCAERV